MLWSRYRGCARAAGLLAAGAIGTLILNGALLVAGPALSGHVVVPWRVAAQPQVEAIGGGVGPPPCLIHARRYRANPTYVPPSRCLNTRWFQGLPLPSEPPPPAPDAPAPAAP
jgi:hypothetical protein